MHVSITHRLSGVTNPWANLLNNPALGARRVSMPAKATVYAPADPATEIFFIHQGQVRTYQSGPNQTRRLVEILGAGDWCGAPAFAELPQYGEGAEAVTASVVSAVPVERLFPFLRTQTTAAVDLIKHLAGKLTSYREIASGLVFDDCHSRLVRTLVQLSQSSAATPAPGGVVVRITHQQLAQAVGVARETVSLALSQLRRRNLLRTGRNQLTFDPKQLLTPETD